MCIYIYYIYTYIFIYIFIYIMFIIRYILITIYNSVYNVSKRFKRQLAGESTHLFSFAVHWVTI